MRIPITMIAMLALLGCSSPQISASAPAPAGPGAAVERPKAPQTTQACAATRPHHGFNYAETDRPASLPALFVATANPKIRVWPSSFASADNSPRCAGTGKHKTNYASLAGAASQPNSG